MLHFEGHRYSSEEEKSFLYWFEFVFPLLKPHQGQIRPTRVDSVPHALGNATKNVGKIKRIP
jgi:hypothetical protein